MAGEIIFNVGLDLVNKYEPAEDIFVSQDNYESVKFIYKITKKDIEEDLTGATNIVVSFNRPDGVLVLQNNGVLVGNRIEIIVDRQSISHTGKVFVWVKYNQGTQVFATRQMFFDVEGSITCKH